MAMSYDIQDTIAAVGSAPGGAARGLVRVSGPEVVAKLSRCFACDDQRLSIQGVRSARRIAGSLRIEGDGLNGPLAIPGHLLLWPSTQSYTRQPSAEFHTIGSPALLGAILGQLSRVGIRSARPGEFTLRAFLAGRMDLTQAEGVLGVIDARDRDDLDAALDQLAGGLSKPLYDIREQLLTVLAELEAGLDFVDEDIEFISRTAIRERLIAGQQVVGKTLSQMAAREARSDLPRVAIVGLPNAGKSTLFNALVRRFGEQSAPRAIVSPEPGATRDYLVCQVNFDGTRCELVDTAGEDDALKGGVHAASQKMTARERRQADLRLRCVDRWVGGDYEFFPGEILALTKSDLSAQAESRHAEACISCSGVSGAGLDEIATAVQLRLAANSDENSRGLVSVATATRCVGSLRHAGEAIAAALELTDSGSEELIAAEIRIALEALGDVVGATSADDILDRIFSQFCIGK
jgi:tRNA modification GTPase